MSKYAVVDLEMCRIPQKTVTPVKKFGSEIIQIGAVLLDENYEVVDKFMSFVSPQYGRMDRYIENLTGIHNSDIEYAPDTHTALEKFAQWLPDNAEMVAWSGSDEAQLRTETLAKSISIPKLDSILDTCIDSQQLFSEVMDTERAYTLTDALSISGIDYRNGAHDALVDAYNTALLFKKLQTEETFTTSYWYGGREAAPALTSNPFADLLKNYAV